MPQVTLRKFPFPYRCALAISNDTDGMTWDSFERMHEFLCAGGETAMGRGLELEIGNSFWLWSDRGEFALHHTRPRLGNQTPAPEMERIQELSKLGWIDTLHSFGDWQPGTQITEQQIELGLSILERNDIHPSIYTNHGGGDLRLHNLSGPWPVYGGGDDEESVFYNLKQLLQNGFKFFWLDYLYELDKFGEEQSRFVGSQYNFDRWEQVSQLGFVRTGDRLNRRARSKNSDRYRVVSRQSLTPEDRLFSSHTQNTLANALYFPLIGRDGSEFYGFKRYRSRQGPNSAVLPDQLSAANLDSLEREEAAVVVYQHMGIWRDPSSSKWDQSQIVNRDPVFDRPTIESLRNLRQREANGSIFVTTTARLLRYLSIRDRTSCKLEKNAEGGWDIFLNIIPDLYGQVVDTDMNDLQGLSFTVPSSVRIDRIFVNEASKSRGFAVADGFPSNDLKTVYFPWTKLKWLSNTRPLSRALTTHYPRRQAPFWRPARHHPSHRLLSNEKISRLDDNIIKFMDSTKRSQQNYIRKQKMSYEAEWSAIKFPRVFGAGSKYAQKMHRVPFEHYVRRIEQLNVGGRRALDAGCGTGTWSIALSQKFEKVDAIDKTQSRVTTARWLLGEFNINNIQVHYGDITDLKYPDNTHDHVYCNGVLITSAVSIEKALREFYRVLNPDGNLYVCLNAPGWSASLANKENSASSVVAGKRGIFNTLVGAHRDEIRSSMSDLLVWTASNLEQCAKTLSCDVPTLIAFVERPGKNNNISSSFFQRVKRHLKEKYYTGDSGLTLPVLSDKANAISILHSLLKRNTKINTDLVDIYNTIERECGTDFSDLFVQDCYEIWLRSRPDFAYNSAGVGYQPPYIQRLLEGIGFVDVVTAEEGEIGFDPKIGESRIELYGGRFQGELKVWEVTARKPS